MTEVTVAVAAEDPWDITITTVAAADANVAFKDMPLSSGPPACTSVEMAADEGAPRVGKTAMKGGYSGTRYLQENKSPFLSVQYTFLSRQGTGVVLSST